MNYNKYKVIFMNIYYKIVLTKYIKNVNKMEQLYIIII